MKLPVQAAAVLRARPAGRIGGSVFADEPSDCKTCKHGPNPCKGSAGNLVSCGSGTCQCCPSTTFHQALGGACVCG